MQIQGGKIQKYKDLLKHLSFKIQKYKPKNQKEREKRRTRERQVREENRRENIVSL